MISKSKAREILNRKGSYSYDEIKEILDFLNPIVEILVNYVELKDPRGEK